MKAKNNFFWLLAAFFIMFHACSEGERFSVTDKNSPAPNPPTFLGYEPLPGGVRIFFDIPDNVDLLSIDAEHTTEAGKKLWFSVSFYVDSLDVFGFVEEKPHNIRLYATNRAGNRSTPVELTVTPMESALPKIYENIDVKGAVRSLLVDWENEMQQPINVFVDFSFRMQGQTRSLTRVFTSNQLVERRPIYDMNIAEGEMVDVSLRIEDLYGNTTSAKSMGQIPLLFDQELDKSLWSFPPAGFVMGGSTMVNANIDEGRIAFLNDGLINDGEEVNYILTPPINPWNVFIDLGRKVELTRIITWQRRFGAALGTDMDGVEGFDPNERRFDRGILYDIMNVGRYRMWRWDDETERWEELSVHRIPIPLGMTDIDVIRMHNERGDEAYIHPEDPRFSKPTRWFRYQALNGFTNNHGSTNANSLAEISLFGRYVD